jgi:hypothetical protein
MNINFNYHGSTYMADLARQGNDKIVVQFDNTELKKQFGTSLPFYIRDKSVEFDILNKCHSDLFALNSSISKAIREQCSDMLYQ